MPTPRTVTETLNAKCDMISINTPPPASILFLYISGLKSDRRISDIGKV